MDITITFVLLALAVVIGLLAGFVARKLSDRGTTIAVPYIVFDVETTGLDPAKNGIIEIAARDSNGREFNMKVRPFDGCAWDEYASQVTGVTQDHVRDWATEVQVMEELGRWLIDAPSGWFFIGANPSFDWAFINALAERTGVRIKLDYHKMDIQSMALAAHCQGKITLPANPKNGQPLVKVDALLKAFHMTRSSDTHGALEDVHLEELVFLRLIAL